MKKRRKSGSLSKAKRSAKSALRKTGSKLKRAAKKQDRILSAPLRGSHRDWHGLNGVQPANHEDVLKVSSPRVAARTDVIDWPGFDQTLFGTTNRPSVGCLTWQEHVRLPS